MHKSVLLEETIKALNIKKEGIYVDLTLGAGGHSLAILKALAGSGFLFAFDQDEEAIKIAKETLKKYSNFRIIKANFKDFKQHLTKLNINQVDGVLMDLGMSSMQIDDFSRGFSYMGDGPLDMRMDKDKTKTAEIVLNTYTESELINIFKMYGDIFYAKPLVKEIIKNRPLKTTFDLVKITDKFKVRKGHSAKHVFQALRIYINDELNVLKEVLDDALEIVNKDGVVAAITFHSLEDKIVKYKFMEVCEQEFIKGLPTLPKEMPFKYYKKKILPSQKEVKSNSRSKSAILRAVIKN